MTRLGCLCPKLASFAIFGCKYVCMYACMYVCMCVCVYVCMYICMYVYHRICLDFKNSLRNRGSFVRSQSIQKENKRTLRTTNNMWLENFKPGRNPVSYSKPRFCKGRVWMQVKVKNSRELKRYVSQWPMETNYNWCKLFEMSCFTHSTSLSPRNY